MKVAEALVLRADAQKRLAQLKERIVRNAKVQEGDKPAEDPAALLKEFNAVADELTLLIQRINRTNSGATLDGISLSDALAARDVVRIRATAYRELANAASLQQVRTTRSEIKFHSTVSVAEIQKQADALSRQHRELDARIQQANWEIDLAD
jgi:hypothetical protein